MEIYDTYSSRKSSTSSNDLPETIPASFRNRVLMFWDDFQQGTLPMAGSFAYNHYGLETFWQEMGQTLRHRYGRPALSPRSTLDPVTDLSNHLNSCNAEEFFDFLEMAFKLPMSWNLLHSSAEVIDAINEMFRFERLPYELTHWITEEKPVVAQRDGSRLPPLPPSATTITTLSYPQVVRVDEEVTHTEAVRPALAALSAPHFSQANQDFLKALKHYRDSEFPDCLTACGATMESTLKVLCDRNRWQYQQRDTLKTLLETVIPKTTLEPFFKETLMHIGTIRNRLSSAHGRGATAQPVPRHIAQYAITCTAAAVILLIEEADL